MDLETYFECPRCDRYLNGFQSLGKLQCSYHPGDLEFINKNKKEICVYSCCKKRPVQINYNAMSLMLGGIVERVHPKVKGCVACDCGNDFEPVAVQDIAEFIADGTLEPASWKRFDQETMYIHRKAR